MGLFNRRKNGDDQKPQGAAEVASPFRDMFTDLAAAVVADPINSTMNAFWKPVYDLDEWHFLPDVPPGESIADRMGSGQPIHPLRVRVEGRLYVAMFTSQSRALDAAQRNGLAKVGEGFGSLSMRRDAAASYLCRLSDAEAEGVLINHHQGERGMTTPLDNIAAQYEHYLGRVPPAHFDRFVRSVYAANAPEVWAKLNKHFTAMDRWLFIGYPDRPQVPQLVKYDDAPVVLLFTDQEHAAQGAVAAKSTDAEGRVPIIPATPREAANYLGDLEKDSAEKGQPVTNVLVNLGSVPFLMAIDDLRRFVAMQEIPAR